MPTVSQLPAQLDAECVAGDPFTISVTSTGATITSPTLSIRTGLGVAVAVSPTVSQAGAVTTVAFSGANTAALNPGPGQTKAEYLFSLSALVDGQGPFQLIARSLTVHPVGTAGVSSSSTATLAVTVGGAAVSLAVTLGIGAGALIAANNLSDVENAATARTNLGLGSAALAASSAFAGAQNLATHIYRPGGYGSFPLGIGWVGSPAQFSNGLLVFVPVVSPVTGTWDRIGIEVVTTAGSVGSVHRLGMWANNAGVPDTLITDFGTVATDTVGLKEITVTQSVTAGVVSWLGVAQQGAPATTAGLRVAFANFQALVTTNPNFNQFGLQSSGNTGAFASAPSIAAGSQIIGVPRIFVRFT